jgi:hypothetical protein
MIPIVDHIGGYSIDSEKFVNIPQTNNFGLIGNKLKELFDFINDCSPSTLTPKERELQSSWKNNTKYKSWNTFWNNNYYSIVDLFEDGHYEIYSLKKSSKKGTYDGIIKKIVLSANVDCTELGIALIDTLDESEKYHKSSQNNNIKHKYVKDKINILSGTTITFLIPQEDDFVDSNDCGAAEIYKCYSYIANEGSEASAEFFLSMAAELDCDLSTENIKSCFEEYNGKSDYFEVSNDNFGIFNLKAEMKNKSVHKISYYLQIDEDEILECSMEVHQPNRRKKVDEKLTTLFQDFVLSCNFTSQK